MNREEALALLPDGKGAVIILSGGMDSTISMRLAVEKYGAENVHALSFFYGQKQAIELEKAKESTAYLGVNHKIAELPFLYQCSLGFSANVDSDIQMPTIHDVLGLPTPPTYVPFRNLNLLCHAAAFAEVNGVEVILAGLQMTDQYGYWDTTKSFVEKLNEVFDENRTIKIKVIAPFVGLDKAREILLLKELDGNVDLLKHTLTCYNPDGFVSCGTCPSCSERKAAFSKVGEIDPIPYKKD